MPDDILSLLHYYKMPAFAVMPANTNKRLEAQDGAFFVFGMKVTSKEVSNNPGTLNRVYYDFAPVVIDSPTQICHNASEIIIPSSAKKQILHQLDMLGVNERKLFPDLEHQIKYTIQDVIYNGIK